MHRSILEEGLWLLEKGVVPERPNLPCLPCLFAPVLFPPRSMQQRFSRSRDPGTVVGVEIGSAIDDVTGEELSDKGRGERKRGERREVRERE
jgi:hypothetical protein